MHPIHCVDLAAQYRSLQPEVDAAIRRVLERGAFILGEENAAFEQEFAQYLGVSEVVGVASGTDALELALRACEVGPGTEVITAANTAGGTIAAIERAGARPVLVDMAVRTYTMAVNQVAAAITPRTRALVPVHLYGCPADLAPLLEIAHAHSLVVIEDCAQAHGAEYHGKKVGAWGDAAAFSFYPTKNLGAYGDGGAVATARLDIAAKVCRLRQYGWAERYVSAGPGMNSRLDELQAAVLRVKLAYLDGWNDRRRVLAQLYRQNLAGSPLSLPIEPADCRAVFHQFVVRTPHRDELRAALQAAQIQTQVLYPVPIHLQPAYQSLGYQRGDFPAAERAAQELFSLPLYPELAEAAILRVCETIHATLKA